MQERNCVQKLYDQLPSALFFEYRLPSHQSYPSMEIFGLGQSGFKGYSCSMFRIALLFDRFDQAMIQMVQSYQSDQLVQSDRIVPSLVFLSVLHNQKNLLDDLPIYIKRYHYQHL
jgi:hypothetical protein